MKFNKDYNFEGYFIKFPDFSLINLEKLISYNIFGPHKFFFDQ